MDIRRLVRAVLLPLRVIDRGVGYDSRSGDVAVCEHRFVDVLIQSIRGIAGDSVNSEE